MFLSRTFILQMRVPDKTSVSSCCIGQAFPEHVCEDAKATAALQTAPGCHTYESRNFNLEICSYMDYLKKKFYQYPVV